MFVSYEGRLNYALSRPASQSSTYADYVAGRAVDGNVNDPSFVSHTDYGDFHPWWKVELAYPIWVTHVEITNTAENGKKCPNTELNKDFFINCSDIPIHL